MCMRSLHYFFRKDDFMADYTAWYRVGTVALTKNSKIVTGSGTYWLSAGLHTGDIFSVDNVVDYEIASVDSNTQLTLKTAYAGNTTTETDYSIVRNFTASMAAQVAAQTANLLNDMRRYVDADMQSIHGKSAYQIACEKGYAGTESEWIASLKGDSAYAVACANGYNGTEAQWLEDLKAAKEWTTLDERTELLKMAGDGTNPPYNYAPAAIRNVLYRGKNLGAFTATDLQNVLNNTFTRMYLGDYFTFEGDTNKYRIAGFNWLREYHVGYYSTRGTIVIIPDATIRVTIDNDGTEYTYNTFGHAAGKFGEDDEGNNLSCYPNSDWFKIIMPKFVEKMEGYFTKLQTFKICVTASVNFTSGAATSSVTLGAKAHLMTFDMLGAPSLWATTPTSPTRNGDRYNMYDMLPLFRVQPGHMYYQDGQYALADCTGTTVNGTQYLQPYHMGEKGHIQVYGGGALRPIFVVGGM